MVKRVGMFSLGEGKDSDEVWKYWTEVHAPNFSKLPGLRKYAINRITEVVKGEVRYWGMAELWFDTEEDYEAAVAQHTPDEFGSLVTEPRFSAWVEEKVII